MNRATGLTRLDPRTRQPADVQNSFNPVHFGPKRGAKPHTGHELDEF